MAVTVSEVPPPTVNRGWMPMPSTRPCTLGRDDSLAGNTENLRLDDPALSTSSAGRGTTMGIKGPLSREELAKIDAYWRAGNYLSVGQIYLYDNPLLRERLTTRHVKPRLLGHFGTTPGLNFVYAHLNRVIKARDLSVIYIAGPGHGGPGLVANTYLEGTYSEVYPEVSQDEAGLKRLCTQCSFPGGIPSHHAPETPGSMHEGGELGYALSHAYGAAFDNPELLVACVIGDGEAETGPLATSWHSNKFLNPAHDGAVLPILHLNGYKIAGPTVLARISRVALAPGAGRRALREAGPRGAARAVDAQLSSRGAVRRARPPANRARRARARGDTAHERQPAHQRRPPAPGPPLAGLSRVRRGSSAPRRHQLLRNAGARHVHP